MASGRPTRRSELCSRLGWAVSAGTVVFAFHLLTMYRQVAERCTGRSLHLGVGALEEVEDRIESVAVDFADIWSLVSTDARHVGLYSLPRSVISANVRLALRCRSTFSEYTKVLRERKGSPEKKSVSVL